MTIRLPCLVPFCRRTRGQRKGDRPIHAGEEWICGIHWRHVSRTKKSRWRRAIRRRDAERDPYRAGRWQAVKKKVWVSIKREAIEAAAGIA